MTHMRTEKDFLGEKKIPAEALFGIHSVRAKENFPDTSSFNLEWYKAMMTVKRACYVASREFFTKAKEQYELYSTKNRHISSSILDTLIDSAILCEEGANYDQFIVPGISGGAGTSINMNVNEILANLSLKKLGENPGTYSMIDPIEHANIFQSTNDVVPTALRIAAMRLLNQLENSINDLRNKVEEKEKKYRNTLRIGYTQMQEAVPTTFGKLFSTYSDALSRDWWRTSKCQERIKVVNLGGSAIGTSVTVPWFFVTEVVRVLQQLTGLPVTRGENLSDATSNLDPFAEIHGILKAHAVNLEKIANDIRLIGSDIYGSKTVDIPQMQVGSSIMPGKVNPVISEFIISACHQVYSNDILITQLTAQGCLELNAYLPVIGGALLSSIQLLIASDNTLGENLIAGLKINESDSKRTFISSPSIVTVLLPYIGYNKASELAKFMKENKKDIYAANKHLQLLEQSKLAEILKPENILKGGYRLKDILDN
jgi:aspartate ammonia-lyase